MNSVSSGLIVGYGSIGARHAANLRSLMPDLPLTVVSRRDDVAEKGIRVVRELGDALAMQPSFAVIASASHLHCGHLLAVLDAGVPCYIEKPPAVTMDELKGIRDRLGRIGALPTTLVGCNLRFLPSLRQLKDLVDSGAAGKVARVSMQAGQWLPDWRPSQDYRKGYGADTSQGGGVILDLMHEIDQARWLFGEFERVCAISAKASSLEIGTEDCAAILLGGDATDPVVSIGLDYVSRRPVRRYEIVGDEATIVWDLAGRRLELIRPGDAEARDCGIAGFDIAETYRSAMREFIQCVERRAATSQDIHDGLKSVELALRARVAAGT